MISQQHNSGLRIEPFLQNLNDQSFFSAGTFFKATDLQEKDISQTLMRFLLSHLAECSFVVIILMRNLPKKRPREVPGKV